MQQNVHGATKLQKLQAHVIWCTGWHHVQRHQGLHHTACSRAGDEMRGAELTSCPDHAKPQKLYTGNAERSTSSCASRLELLSAVHI